MVPDPVLAVDSNSVTASIAVLTSVAVIVVSLPSNVSVSVFDVDSKFAATPAIRLRAEAVDPVVKLLPLIVSVVASVEVVPENWVNPSIAAMTSLTAISVWALSNVNVSVSGEPSA